MKKLEIKMPKERNVINLVILIVLSINCSAQNVLEGTYARQNMPYDTYSFYKFQQDGGFEYHSGGDLGDESFGKGTYRISADTLFLDYNENTAVQLPYHKGYFWKDFTDSITIEIQVKDFEGNPIGYTNVASTENRIGIVLDSEGFGRLRLRRIEDDYDITVSFIGYESHDIKIFGTKNYRLEVFLSDCCLGSPIYEYMDTLKILEFTESHMRLKNRNGVVSEWVKNSKD